MVYHVHLHIAVPLIHPIPFVAVVADNLLHLHTSFALVDHTDLICEPPLVGHSLANVVGCPFHDIVVVVVVVVVDIIHSVHVVYPAVCPVLDLIWVVVVVDRIHSVYILYLAAFLIHLKLFVVVVVVYLQFVFH